MDALITVWEAIKQGDDRAINVALVGVILIGGWRAVVYLGNRLSTRLDKLEKTQSDLSARQDAFEKKVLTEYVSQDQLDRRIGGLKEMIAKLTEAVSELQTNVAVIMSHLGLTGINPHKSVIRAPAKRKASTTRKGK